MPLFNKNSDAALPHVYSDRKKTFKRPRTESKLKVEVRDMLNEAGAWTFMPVPTGMQKATLDFLGCYKGRFFAIETKRPGEVPTERQTITMQKIKNAGGFAIWGDSIDHIRTFFNLWASAHVEEVASLRAELALEKKANDEVIAELDRLRGD